MPRFASQIGGRVTSACMLTNPSPLLHIPRSTCRRCSRTTLQTSRWMASTSSWRFGIRPDRRTTIDCDRCPTLIRTSSLSASLLTRLIHLTMFRKRCVFTCGHDMWLCGSIQSVTHSKGFSYAREKMLTRIAFCDVFLNSGSRKCCTSARTCQSSWSVARRICVAIPRLSKSCERRVSDRFRQKRLVLFFSSSPRPCDDGKQAQADCVCYLGNERRAKDWSGTIPGMLG